jgi:hypothetical protein
MIRIIAVLLLGLGLGALFTAPGIAWPVRPGWIGAAILVAAALAARAYWRRRRDRVGDEPGAPEREVWQGMAGAAMVAGQMVGGLAQPGLDLHVGQGNTLALDNWTILAGAVIGWFILRNREAERDERDRAIAAGGTRVGYVGLILMLVALSLFLGFAPGPYRPPLDDFALANILSALIVLSYLARQTARLVAYWRDVRPLEAAR